MNVDIPKAIEAAKVLFHGGEKKDSLAILRKLWEEGELNGGQEFSIFCALVEVWTLSQGAEVVEFLESVMSGEESYRSFWLRRSASEQAILLDWHGQICLATGDKQRAFDSLGRAASLGRDTHHLWKQLGSLYIDVGELELGLRYVRRSLQLFRQMDLDLLSGKEEVLGSFTGRSLLKAGTLLEDYLEILLRATKLAKGQKNLKSVRELVLEMMHQFPHEHRLPKIRLLIERTIVESSLQFTNVSSASASQRVALKTTVRVGLPSSVV